MRISGRIVKNVGKAKETIGVLNFGALAKRRKLQNGGWTLAKQEQITDCGFAKVTTDYQIQKKNSNSNGMKCLVVGGVGDQENSPATYS